MAQRQERQIEPERALWRQRITRSIGLTAAGLVVAIPTAAAVFSHSETRTELVATDVTIAPTFDGYFTAHNGLLPDVRYPLNLPLHMGISVDVRNSTTPPSKTAGGNIEALMHTYGAVAAQPAGEAQHIREVITGQAITASQWGALAGLAPVGLYYLLGEKRRRELLEKAHDGKFQTAAIISSAALVLGSSTLMRDTPAPTINTNWVAATSLVPELNNYPEAQGMEISDNAVSGAAKELLNGAFDSYNQSKKFYASLLEKIEPIQSQLHQPEPGEIVGILLSDRHDNIGMDPVHRKLADAAGASLMIDAGDDTSSGKPWEEFSLRSLHQQFKDFSIMAVPGNHDSGKFVANYWHQHGAITPNNEVKEIDGIHTFLIGDPRYSDYTGAVVDGETTFADSQEQIVEATCGSDERVNLIVTHQADMASDALEQGCVDLAVGGHRHVASSPVQVQGENGETGYTLTNGTSGGAAYSFSAFGRLRRDATDTLITFRDGRPVGTQLVTFRTTKEVVVGPYEPLIYPANRLLKNPNMNDHLTEPVSPRQEQPSPRS